MPLVPFASVDRSALRWLRTGETVAEYTLLSGDAAVATIRWARRRGAGAVAETADGAWALGRHGFFVPHLTARRTPDAPPVARLTNHLGHHRIEIGGGASYRLRRAGLLLPAWSLTTERGEEVAHLEAAGETRRLDGGAVIVAPGTIAPAELLLLLLLSWYLIALLWFEDEAVEALVPLEGPDAATGWSRPPA